MSYTVRSRVTCMFLLKAQKALQSNNYLKEYACLKVCCISEQTLCEEVIVIFLISRILENVFMGNGMYSSFPSWVSRL